MINRFFSPLFNVHAVAFVACVLAGTMILPAEEKEYKKSELQEIYMSYLKEEGYQPSIDDDGDVQFKKEGGKYFIAVNESDPQFFRIVYPGFWKIEDEAEEEKALKAVHEATSKTKVAKVYIVKDRVWGSVELFVESPEDFKPIFGRSLSALDAGVKNFVDTMRK